MSSTILTKVNTVRPKNFNEQIEWMNLDVIHTPEQFKFLQQFVELCHKKTDLVKMPTAGTIDAHTSKGNYRYTIYSKHIVRMDLTDALKKKFYQIS